jgi:dihydrofolate reductase
MRTLIETTQASLGGEVGSIQDWVFPFLDEEFKAYTKQQLFEADSLLLGRMTYETLSAAYPTMSGGGSEVFTAFIERINSIPKHVASTTLRETSWNATVIEGDVASFVRDLKQQPGGNIIKCGNGPLDVTLMEHGLIDEFHLLLIPVAVGKGQHMFEDIETAPSLNLSDVKRFKSGVVALVYTKS